MNDELIRLFNKESISKRELAMRCGLPYTTVNRLLNQKLEINHCEAMTLARLAAHFEVDMFSLMDRFPLLDGVEGKCGDIPYRWEYNGNDMEIVFEKNGEKHRRVMGRMLVPPAHVKYASAVAEMGIQRESEEMAAKERLDRVTEEYLNGRHLSAQA